MELPREKPKDRKKCGGGHQVAHHVQTDELFGPANPVIAATVEVVGIQQLLEEFPHGSQPPQCRRRGVRAVNIAVERSEVKSSDLICERVGYSDAHNSLSGRLI